MDYLEEYEQMVVAVAAEYQRKYPMTVYGLLVTHKSIKSGQRYQEKTRTNS